VAKACKDKTKEDLQHSFPPTTQRPFNAVNVSCLTSRIVCWEASIQSSPTPPIPQPATAAKILPLLHAPRHITAHGIVQVLTPIRLTLNTFAPSLRTTAEITTPSTSRTLATHRMLPSPTSLKDRLASTRYKLSVALQAQSLMIQVEPKWSMYSTRITRSTIPSQ
jgi:hypothetical protein